MADERGDGRIKRLFTERANVNASGIREKITVYSGLRFIGNILLYIFVILIAVFIISTIVVGLIGGTKTGFFQYVYEAGSNLVVKVPILTSVIEVFKTIQDPTRTIRTFDWQADIDKNSQNQDLGLTFQKFSSLKKTYLPGEPLIFIGTVKASSLKDDSKVSFSCDATTDKIAGSIQPDEPVVLPKDSTQVFSVRCEIPSETIKLEGKKIRAETVVLKAKYDFTTKAFVEAYTMSKKILTQKQNNQENPFEEDGIPITNNNRLNRQTGEVRSEYTMGPMKVLINSEYTQPFTEAGPFQSNPYYSLGIAIEKASSFYQGRLSRINNVYLYIPKNFELKDDDKFEIIEYEDEVFDKYKLKEDEVNELNSYCKGASLLDFECSDFWERGFILVLTGFKISSLNKETLDTSYLRAEVEYEFQAETSQVVTVVESFQSA